MHQFIEKQHIQRRTGMVLLVIAAVVWSAAAPAMAGSILDSINNTQRPRENATVSAGGETAPPASGETDESKIDLETAFTRFSYNLQQSFSDLFSLGFLFRPSVEFTARHLLFPPLYFYDSYRKNLDEYRFRKMTRETLDDIAGLYLEHLDRYPDPDGWNFYLRKVRDGDWNIDDVKNAILSSKEYADKHPPEKPPREPKKSTGSVNTRVGLNVRTGPGIGNTKIGLLPYGTSVTILAEKDGWYKISFGDGTAWVCGDYIDLDVGGSKPPADDSGRDSDVVDDSWIENFSYEAVMSDSSFTDVDAMSQREIQSFLERKGSVLAKSYRGTYPSKLIYDACQEYGVSPKMMLARLQTEQGLVSKKSATQHQLDWALGVGCYDSGNWNTKYQGFGKQVRYAAATLRNHYDDGRNAIARDGSIAMTIDGTRLSVQNAATYSLYRYTPHKHGTKLFFDVFVGYFALLLMFLLKALFA